MRYRDLMTTAMLGQATPLTPVGLWRHEPVADQQAETLAMATCALQTRFDSDFAKLTPASTWQARDHGLVDVWNGDAIGRRSVTTTIVHDPEDWLLLRRLDPHGGFSGMIVRAAVLTRRDLPAPVPLLATVFNPLFQAAQLAGIDRLTQHMRDFPDAVRAGLDTLRLNTLALIRAFAEAGVEGIFLASQHACASAFTADVYAALALADDLVCLDAAAHLPFSMLHLHGQDVHADLFVDQPYAMLHYDRAGNPPPDRLTVARGLSTGPSPGGASGDLAALCHAFRGRPFFLTPGCAPVLSESERLFAAMIHAARSGAVRDAA